MEVNFEEQKKNILKDLEDFTKKYDEFTKLISPKNWRSSGHHFSELKQMSEQISRFEEITNFEKNSILLQHVRDSKSKEETRFRIKIEKWYSEHKEHVDKLMSTAEYGYVPSDEDYNNPELWKPQHWNWYFKKSELKRIEKWESENSGK